MWIAATIGHGGDGGGWLATIRAGDRSVGAKAIVLIAPPERLDLRQIRDIGKQLIQTKNDEPGEAADLRIGQSP